MCKPILVFIFCPLVKLNNCETSVKTEGTLFSYHFKSKKGPRLCQGFPPLVSAMNFTYTQAKALKDQHWWRTKGCRYCNIVDTKAYLLGHQRRVIGFSSSPKGRGQKNY